jgi:hypothetical protein
MKITNTKIQIDLAGWVLNNLVALIFLGPFFWVVLPSSPFLSGVAAGIYVMSWVTILIF